MSTCIQCKYFKSNDIDNNGMCYYDPPRKEEGRPFIRSDDFCSKFTSKSMTLGERDEFLYGKSESLESVYMGLEKEGLLSIMKGVDDVKNGRVNEIDEF